ncbi:MAG: hypothetical protein QM500_00630 [Methylococcales bacterium]
MQLSLTHRPFTVILAILTIVSLAGCAQVRKLTYTEDFTYIENREVKSLMRMMGKGVEKLGQITDNSSTTDTNLQQQIISEMSELQSIAARLSAGHTQTNQLFISDHIEQFISDIGTAKMFAKTNPPDYSKVGEIVNNCQECHKLR